MRIALFSDSFLPYICGATFALVNQANALAARGHTVRIFCPGGGKRRHASARSVELDGSIEVERVPLALPWSGQPNLDVVLPTFLPTIARARAFAPDVIHAHTEWGVGWVALLAGRRLRVPVVGTFHTFWDDPRYMRHFPFPNWAVFRRAMGAYSAFFYRRCTATIAPSLSVQRHLRQRGLAARVVSNGIPRPVLVPPAEIRARREAMGLADGPVFLYLGRVSSEKTLPLCLDAFARVLAARPSARFVVIGGGPDEKRFDAHARSLGIGDRVVRTGMVPHEALMAENLPRVGDVFVTASETENQPISVLEAMAFGMPVIGPSARGVPELVEDGVNGRLFPPGDATQLARHMCDLADDPALRGEMAAAAARTAEFHFIENSARCLEEIYARCIAETATVTAVRSSPVVDEVPTRSQSD
jgi:glycosyltransferase involved in cell wall biosynthesis